LSVVLRGYHGYLRIDDHRDDHRMHGHR
jgi:hypothetical protein